MSETPTTNKKMIPNSQQTAPWAKVMGLLVLIGLGVMVVLALRPRTATQNPHAAAELVVEPPRASAPAFVTPPAAPDPAPVPKAPVVPAKALPACTACEAENRGKDGCNADMGCESLTGEDKTLCESLLACMRNNPDCWGVNPSKCFCGTTRGTDCAKNPNGPCAAEAIAAAKTDSPLTAGLRFFKTEFPSGRATHQIVCSLSACKAQCRP